ncbi:MAG: cbb3-type cytochrome oxidase assembly protein CcoS [Dokdonella sp.]
MAILLFLIPVSIILLCVAIWAFIAAVRGGQFDDLDTPPLDILRDDDADDAPRQDDRAD